VQGSPEIEKMLMQMMKDMAIQQLQELIKQLKKWHVVRKDHQVPRRTEDK